MSLCSQVIKNNMQTIVTNFINDILFTCVEDIKKPERYLTSSADILNKIGVKWYFGFGTAIGLYRDKDFVPRDTDVDIIILADDKTPIKEIIEIFESEYHYIRSVTRDGKQMQSAFQGEDGYIVDICFFWDDGEDLISYCGGGLWRDDKETIGNLQNIKTKYGIFPFPEHIEDYLKTRYGDWKTPKHGAISSSIKE